VQRAYPNNPFPCWTTTRDLVEWNLSSSRLHGVSRTMDSHFVGNPCHRQHCKSRQVNHRPQWMNGMDCRYCTSACCTVVESFPPSAKVKQPMPARSHKQFHHSHSQVKSNGMWSIVFLLLAVHDGFDRHNECTETIRVRVHFWNHPLTGSIGYGLRPCPFQMLAEPMD